AGAVARDAADQRRQHAHAGDQHNLDQRKCSEGGEHGRRRQGLAAAATAASASAASAALSSGKPAAIHASSAAVSAAPMRGPLSTPRLAKSLDFSGNFGALQRVGSIARSFHGASATPAGERAQAISTRST